MSYAHYMKSILDMCNNHHGKRLVESIQSKLHISSKCEKKYYVKWLRNSELRCLRGRFIIETPPSYGTSNADLSNRLAVDRLFELSPFA